MNRTFSVKDDPFFACPVGEALWHGYRVLHPEAPLEPPSGAEDDPDASGDSAPYWDHCTICGNFRLGAMPRTIRFKKQYKPIGFGDAPDSRTVEGHRLAVREGIETRRANRELRELAVEREARRPSLLVRIFNRIRGPRY